MSRWPWLRLSMAWVPMMVAPLLVTAFVTVTGCNHCPPAGPSGSLTVASGTLGPSERREVIVQTPDGTSEVRVTGTFQRVRIWTVDPDCSRPIAECATDTGNLEGDRLRFGSARGHNYNDFAATARFFVENMSATETVEFQLTFTPWRPGCT